MTGAREPDDVERLLADAFDAQARASVSDHVVPPPPRFAAPATPRHRSRWLAPLAAAAAVIAVAGGVLAATHRNTTSDTAARPSQAGPTLAVPAADRAAPGATPVHLKLLNDDGATYGVGMPVIAYVSRSITDARPLTRATTVTADGRAIDAQWYFEPSKAGHGPLEAHLRPQSYWPAHTQIRVSIAAQGLSAGRHLGYDDSLTLDFTTGARNIAVVDDATHRLTLTSDGAVRGSYPVSLGSSRTPTMAGTKVIMQKGGDACMTGPGYRECHVKYLQRLSYGGEYLLAAPWNKGNIATGVDTSNGCTNLQSEDAKKLYAALEVGDVVNYPDATGRDMTIGAGYGDWNLSWTNWLTGGAVRTH